MDKLNIAIVSFMTIIIAVTLLVIVSNNVNKQGDLALIKNDTFVMTNGTCVSLTTGCIQSISQVANNTDVIGTGNYSLCNILTTKPNYDGVRLSGDGLVGIYSGVTLRATYIESSDCSYNPDATSRNLSGLILIFFVLAIVAVGIWYVKEVGLDFSK